MDKEFNMRIKIHSIIDVITNSSSELFISRGQECVETISRILEEKW